MPLVSVIIPVYNRFSLIQRAVKSVISQTFQDIEIIIIDDGSTDKTNQIIELLRKKDPRIKTISLPFNNGVSYSRNVGINDASGEYIALLDSDDTWEPNKLELQIGFFKKNPEYSICHTDEIWIRKGIRVNPMKKHKKPAGRIFHDCIPLCAVSPSSVLINKNILINEALFDENLPVCEDYDLWLRLSAKYNFGLINEKLVIKYGGHPDQLSTKLWGMDRFRIISLLNIIDNNNLNTEEKIAVKDMIINKARILSSGFKKRGKSFQAKIYNDLVESINSKKKHSN